MGINDIGDIDSDEGGSEWWTEQQSEAWKAKAGRSLAGIQRTKKDEKKAQRDNDYLHLCLREIITSRQYDILIPYIFPLFDAWVPSHIIIGAFSLIHQHASDIIRDHYISTWNDILLASEKILSDTEGHTTSVQDTKMSSPLHVYSHRSFVLGAFSSPVEFDDETIDPAIRKRINEWVEDIFTVVSHDPSVVMTQRFMDILRGKENKGIIHLLSGILIFFLLRVNVHISPERATVYTEFILKEVEKKVKSLQIKSL